MLCGCSESPGKPETGNATGSGEIKRSLAATVIDLSEEVNWQVLLTWEGGCSGGWGKKERCYPLKLWYLPLYMRLIKHQGMLLRKEVKTDKFSRSLLTFLAERDQKQYKKKV